MEYLLAWRMSKTIDAPYAPGNRGLWRKAKWLNRQEFVVVGWSDLEGSRPHLAALLLKLLHR
jgi:bifunctional non-homologous end joining protein LigD